MQIAAGSSILDAMATEATSARTPRRDPAPAATRPQTWVAPTTIERGRLIDLVV